MVSLPSVSKQLIFYQDGCVLRYGKIILKKYNSGQDQRRAVKILQGEAIEIKSSDCLETNSQPPGFS